MNEEQQQFAPAPAARKKLVAYAIIEREGLEKAIFSRIGTAFVNKDGSLNIHLDSLPIDGKVHVREDKPRADWNPKAGTPPRRGPVGVVEAEA